MESSTSDQLTLFAEDSRDPAKTSVSQEKAQELRDRGQDYGQSSPVLLANYDRVTQSWRTSQLCLEGGLAEFLETWPRSGMTRSGTSFLLPTLELHTEGTESGSWPTPDAMVANLTEDLENWKGRRARVKAEKKNGNGFGTPLAVAVRLWPAPTRHNAKETNAPSESLRNTPTLAAQVGGYLNPTWVEWLMGFPLGWTALNPSETPSSPKSPNSSDAQS